MWVLIIGACEQIGMRLVLWKAVVLSQQCPNGASFLSIVVQDIAPRQDATFACISLPTALILYHTLQIKLFSE